MEARRAGDPPSPKRAGHGGVVEVNGAVCTSLRLREAGRTVLDVGDGAEDLGPLGVDARVVALECRRVWPIVAAGRIAP